MSSKLFATQEWDDDVPQMEQQEVLGQRIKLKKSKKNTNPSDIITSKNLVSNKDESKIENGIEKQSKKKKKKISVSETYVKYDEPEMNTSFDNDDVKNKSKYDFDNSISEEKLKSKKKRKNKNDIEVNDDYSKQINEIAEKVDNVSGLSKNQKKKLKKLKAKFENTTNNVDADTLINKEKIQNKLISKESKKGNDRKIKNIAKQLLKKTDEVSKDNGNDKAPNVADNLTPVKSKTKKSKNKIKKENKKIEQQQDSQEALIEKSALPIDNKPKNNLKGIKKKPNFYVNKLKNLLDNAKIDVTEKKVDNKNVPNENEEILMKINEIVEKEPVKTAPKTLRQRMLERIKGARFRYLNEQLYVTESSGANKIFKEDPESFKAYHEGYRQQISKWPLNPLDIIINDIKKISKDHIIADMGCGDAKLAKSVPQKVYSFDLIALDPLVNACDMAHTPVLSSHVNIVVFCLSLMGTNLNDYLLEANRILKIGGFLKVAEVESRFENIEQFIADVKKFGFSLIKKDLNNNLFYFIDFKKDNDVKNRNKLPQIQLNPCLYKKR